MAPEGRQMQKRMNAWQSGLLATSALAATLFASSQLWHQGHPEWAFVLAFAAVWALISISWANIDFSEKSGTMLAQVVDHNFEGMHERLKFLEKELERLGEELPEWVRKAS